LFFAPFKGQATGYQAAFVTPSETADGSSAACASFVYNMFGSTMGSLCK